MPDALSLIIAMKLANDKQSAALLRSLGPFMPKEAKAPIEGALAVMPLFGSDEAGRMKALCSLMGVDESKLDSEAEKLRLFSAMTR